MAAAGEASAALAEQLLAEAELRVPAQPLAAGPPRQPPALRGLAPPPRALPQVVVPLVLADPVVAPEVLVHRRSRQSFSAAMASSSLSPGAPTCAPVRRSR